MRFDSSQFLSLVYLTSMSCDPCDCPSPWYPRCEWPSELGFGFNRLQGFPASHEHNDAFSLREVGGPQVIGGPLMIHIGTKCSTHVAVDRQQSSSRNAVTTVVVCHMCVFLFVPQTRVQPCISASTCHIPRFAVALLWLFDSRMDQDLRRARLSVQCTGKQR